VKISKLINIIIVLFLLTAFLPPREANAAWLITGNETLSGPTTAIKDWVITSGGSLTINPGVVVTVNCSDSEPYASGTDPNKIEIIVEDGILIADDVTFQGASTGACWHGISILGDGDAEITNSTIKDARIGITVQGSSPIITGNTIRDIRGADQTPTSFPQHAMGIWVDSAQPGLEILNNTITNIRAGSGCNTCNLPNGRIAYGINVSDTNNVLIEGNSITSLYGGNGGTGAAGVAGANGAAATSPSSPHGQPGENGTDGQDGGEGGAAYGILMHSTLPGISINVINNSISTIYGGAGAIGGIGGLGGGGGSGYSQTAPYGGYSADGGFGGKGGNGGKSGNGGFGGNAYGIMGWNVITSILDNQVGTILPGGTGMGPQGQNGGRGGSGGNGSPVSTAPQIPAGYGGGGGMGGNGSAGGDGGNPGYGYGVAMEFGTLAEFSGNTVNYVFGANTSTGGAGKSGNGGGSGGNGGNGTVSYVKGGGGGAGGYGGSSGNGGNGGNGSSAFGLYMNNVSFISIEGNTMARISSGAGANGGTGGTGINTGGVGGDVGSYPDVAISSVKGGRGGVGSAGGIGGSGGSAGYAYGMYISNPGSVGTLVNNLVYNIEAKSGANGGIGGDGTTGGAGGRGYSTRPGGDGGNGGAAGNGGIGGLNASGASNAYGIMIKQTAGTTTYNMTVTNNTLATVKSAASIPAGGVKGTFGAGGAGGTGTPAGTAGLPGSTGSNGAAGWAGFAIGYYSGDRIISSLYNNIVVSLEPSPTNSIGLSKVTSGTFNYFRAGDAWGWFRNYDTNLTGIDTVGSISADPLFKDPAGYNFRLQSISPCIDTSNNSAPAVPPVDRDDVPRPLNGLVDMGAYEFGSYYKFSQASASVNEGAGTITFTIEHVGYLDSAGKVYFTFADGTAVKGQDFIHGNSFASFTAGTVGGTRTFSPTIIEDTELEGPETFQVILSAPEGGALMAPSTMTITIIDNEGFFTFLPLIIR
jgi:hypothetical protein